MFGDGEKESKSGRIKHDPGTYLALEDGGDRKAEGGRGRDRAHVDVYMAHRVTFEDFL